MLKKYHKLLARFYCVSVEIWLLPFISSTLLNKKLIAIGDENYWSWYYDSIGFWYLVYDLHRVALSPWSVVILSHVWRWISAEEGSRCHLIVFITSQMPYQYSVYTDNGRKLQQRSQGALLCIVTVFVFITPFVKQ